NNAGAGKHVGHRAGFAKVATVAGHRGADFSCRAVAVICQTLDQHGNTVGAIAFVHDVFPVSATGFFTGATLARALDVVVGDGGLLGLFDHVVQGWVGCRVTATGSRCNFDIFD